MKKWIAVIFLIPVLSFGANITTRDGSVYKEAEVLKVEDDGLRISFVAGVAKIPFENLTDSLRQQYHFDSAKVAAYRRSVDEAKRMEAQKILEAQRAVVKKQEEQKALAALAQPTETEKPVIVKKSDVGINSNDTLKTIAEIVVPFIVIVGGGYIYFLPAIVARRHGKRNTNAIFVLNLCLGWLLIPWVVALVWATAKDD